MELESKPRKMRFISGPVQQVEDWLAAHDGQYLAIQFAWAVIKDEQHVTAQCILVSELEKQMRMQHLGMQGAIPGNQRRM